MIVESAIPYSDFKAIHEKCGIAAVWDNDRNAPLLVRRVLLALQHRGQESAGITVYKKTKGLITYKNMGQITNVITDSVIKKFGKAKYAIAQNRYSTSGKSSVTNCQPFTQKNKGYAISIGHNGNIPDVEYLNTHVIKKLKASSDTALLTAFLLQNRPQYTSWMKTLQYSLPNIKGAYCLVILTENGSIFAARDPYGIRPLCIGKLPSGWVIASESCGLDAIAAHYIREIQRGEIISISPHGELTSAFFGEPKRQMICLFEHIYFSRPDSYLNGRRIKYSRMALGQALAKRIKEKGIQPDIVVPILHSGYYAAKGVSEELGLPLIQAIITSNYFGRTFIHPVQHKRIFAVNGKHNFIPDDVAGKKVLFIDDSAVRSTTSKALTGGLLAAGAKEVYAGFSSPPIINPCDLGIDMKSKDELIAGQWENEPLDTIEENVARVIGAHQVVYLPLKNTIQAIGGTLQDYYSYYFGGLHPLRSTHQKFPSLKRTINKAKIVVFVSRSGTNLQKIIEEIRDGNLNAEISYVVSNKKDAYALQRAARNKIPTFVLISKNILNDKNKREDYNEKLVQFITEIKPDIIVLAGWLIILSDSFLESMQRMQIPVINLHPALLTETNAEITNTSRGKLPVLRGAFSIKEAFEKQLPVSGVSVYQLLPGFEHDTGSIIIREEVRRNPDDTFEKWETKIHEAEYRALPTAIQRVIHVMQKGVDVSKGEYKWS